MATPMSLSITFSLLLVCFQFLTVHSLYPTDSSTGNENAPPVPSPAHSPAADYASPPQPVNTPSPSPAPEQARSPSSEAPKSAPASSPPAPSPDLHNSPSPTPSPDSAPAPAPSSAADVTSRNDVKENEESSSGSGMNGGKKAGIAVGVIAAACLVGLGGLVYKKRQDNIRRSQYGYAARRELL